MFSKTVLGLSMAMLMGIVGCGENQDCCTSSSTSITGTQAETERVKTKKSNMDTDDYDTFPRHER